jgi:hypothetical protein
VAHGFTIKCEKCGSENCRVEPQPNYEFIQIAIICDDCGQEE